jgi:hypothetical protein
VVPVRAAHRLGVVALVTMPSASPDAFKIKERNNMKAMSHKPSKQQKIALDNLLRKTVRERFGHPVAIIKQLGVRFTNSDQGSPYIRMLLENGFTAFISGWHKGKAVCTISDGKADPKSYSIRMYSERQARIAARKKAVA